MSVLLSAFSNCMFFSQYHIKPHSHKPIIINTSGFLNACFAIQYLCTGHKTKPLCFVFATLVKLSDMLN